MGKVITVWGSPGSGKSMFSCILSKALTDVYKRQPLHSRFLFRLPSRFLLYLFTLCHSCIGNIAYNTTPPIKAIIEICKEGSGGNDQE